MWGLAFGALVISMLKDLAVAAISIVGLLFELIAAVCDISTEE